MFIVVKSVIIKWQIPTLENTQFVRNFVKPIIVKPEWNVSGSRHFPGHQDCFKYSEKKVVKWKLDNCM